MCESKVIRKIEEKEETIMEDVIRIEVRNNALRIYGILGEQSELKGKIILVDMQNHVVVIE
jgi:predicted RNA-binding protein